MNVLKKPATLGFPVRTDLNALCQGRSRPCPQAPWRPAEIPLGPPPRRSRTAPRGRHSRWSPHPGREPQAREDDVNGNAFPALGMDAGVLLIRCDLQTGDENPQFLLGHKCKRLDLPKELLWGKHIVDVARSLQRGAGHIGIKPTGKCSCCMPRGSETLNSQQSISRSGAIGSSVPAAVCPAVENRHRSFQDRFPEPC